MQATPKASWAQREESIWLGPEEALAFDDMRP